MCAVLFFSCDTENIGEPSTEKNYNWRPSDHNHDGRSSDDNLLSRCDKVIIKNQKKIIEDGGRLPFKPNAKQDYEIKDKKQIINFRKLFKDEERSGYCCCPKVNFSIYCFEGDNNILDYDVDTISSATEVEIFHPRFQYSYIIQKTAWKSFLDNL